MNLPPTKAIAAALGGTAALVIAVLPSFGVVHWSAAQMTDVSLFATAVVALIVSLIAHFRPGTPAEPVALGASITATIGAALTAGNAFGWWHLADQDIATILASVAVLVGGGTAAAARQLVTPVPAAKRGAKS